MTYAIPSACLPRLDGVMGPLTSVACRLMGILCGGSISFDIVKNESM